MKFDVLSVFPEFFHVLDLSLIGKARKRGLIDVQVHNLRDWAHDVHRTVDDAPFGGGAGMVMKPDVWAEALDAVIGFSSAPHGCESSGDAKPLASVDTAGAADGIGSTGGAHATDSDGSTYADGGAEAMNIAGGACETSDTVVWADSIVLAIPTPSGIPLTQALCEQLADEADRIVIACGRYEGIDARVADYYRAQSGMCVLEYSLGDYVLNGGEIAAVALIEAVGRLVPGVVGNPESLVEESYGTAGLLEYPVFTRPVDFRGLTVPSVLTSGDHKAVERWRKDRALERTARRRPDMVMRMDARNLDKKDRVSLARLGYFVAKEPDPEGNSDGSGTAQLTRVLFRRAHPNEAAALSALAVRTFPDAAPPYISSDDIQLHIERQLQPENFSQLLSHPQRNLIMVAQVCDRAGAPTADLAGYTWVIVPEEDGVAGIDEGAPVDFVTADGIRRDGPLMCVERVYLDRRWRGSGMFRELMDATLDQLRRQLGRRLPVPAAPYLWLGTNEANRRAQRAYRHYGFERSGERTFYVGEQINNDLTMCLRLDMAQ